MLPLSYYFRNNYKKSWYIRGKLDCTEYDKYINQQWKDGNVFVKKLVDSVLEDQEKTVKDNITKLEIETNNIDKELKKIQDKKSEEEDILYEVFENKKQILEKEKDRIKDDFSKNSLLDTQQLKSAKELLWNLLKFLWTYAEEVKKWVTGQAEKLLSQRKSALKYNTKIAAKEIKEKISSEINKNKEQEIKEKKTWNMNVLWKSLWYLIILWVICIFDIFLGYVWIVWFLRRSITQERAVVALWLFLAAVLIPLAISLIHFAVVAKKKGWPTKQLWNITIIIVVFLLILYACQSIGKEEWIMLQNFSLWNLINVLQKNPEFLLRCFIIPSLFAWEIIIDLINRDSIIEYFWIWKKKPSNYLSNIITNVVYFLNSKKISNYAKEEKKAIENTINEMQKEEVPAFTEIKRDISEIQSVLDPIRDTQHNKIEEYNLKISNINKKIDENLAEYNENLQKISNKYYSEITKLENTKKTNEIKINKLKHDLNQASIDVKEWVLIWLINNK